MEKKHILWIILFILSLIFEFIQIYIPNTKYFTPFIILLIYTIVFTILIKFECKKILFLKSLNKVTQLLSLFYFLKYTINCLPLIKITFNKIFENKYIGNMIKFIFSFIAMYLFNIIENTKINICEQTQNLFINSILFIIIISNNII